MAHKSKIIRQPISEHFIPLKSTLSPLNINVSIIRRKLMLVSPLSSLACVASVPVRANEIRVTVLLSPHFSRGPNAKTPSRGPNFVRSVRERLLRRLSSLAHKLLLLMFMRMLASQVKTNLGLVGALFDP